MPDEEMTIEKWKAHEHCPGGRQATPEDLIEALGGEKVWYCTSHFHLGDEDYCTDLVTVQPSCRMVERILTPALDQEKET